MLSFVQDTVKRLTGVQEVDVLAIESLFQAERHDPQLHNLLAYRHVWSSDVDLHLRVVDLTSEAVANDLWEVPAKQTQAMCVCVCIYVSDWESDLPAL